MLLHCGCGCGIVERSGRSCSSARTSTEETCVFDRRGPWVLAAVGCDDGHDKDDAKVRHDCQGGVYEWVEADRQKVDSRTSHVRYENAMRACSS